MKRILKILLAGSFIWYFGEGLLGPLYALFAEDIGGDILAITWAWAVYLVVGGFVSIIISNWADRKKNLGELMVLGYALNTIATFGYLLVKIPMHLFIVQAILGVASAIANPTWNAIYSGHADKNKICSEWGIADGGPRIVIGVAVVLGGFIVSHYSFKTLFIIMGCVQIIATLVQASILIKEK